MYALNNETLDFVTIYVESVEQGTSWGDDGRTFDLTIYNDDTGEKWREVTYSMGSGLTYEPTAEEVLWAVSQDAQAGGDYPTLEHFCKDFGYDQDSRSAYAMWEVCRETYDKWVSFFTDEQREQISEATEDM